MKRKFSDRANWRRIISKTYSSHFCNDEHFQGLVTFYHIHELRNPLWKTYNNRKVCLADRDYVWTQHFPQGEDYVVTTMFNNEGKVVQWYIDICKAQGFTDQQVPWFDDMYLDIVVLPSGEIMLMDEDELQDALVQGDVTIKEAESAKQTADKLLQAIHAGQFPYFELSMDHYKQKYT
ncbi:DUF402 domain-containing protein [Paenibacillus sp. GXUN7292]|uniref:DUF402 domain-containing protein n=1 Tax=Paenibacillus sp. GXUN7292 TaxID=3422499 RepID=UPI003D7D4687